MYPPESSSTESASHAVHGVAPMNTIELAGTPAAVGAGQVSSTTTASACPVAEQLAQLGVTRNLDARIGEILSRGSGT